MVRAPLLGIDRIWFRECRQGEAVAASGVALRCRNIGVYGNPFAPPWLFEHTANISGVALLAVVDEARSVSFVQPLLLARALNN